MNTIRFYIILKHHHRDWRCKIVWILYVFTSFSNRLFLRFFWLPVWILYVFTSFSNALRFQYRIRQFEYYTFLHHSQTECKHRPCNWLFEYYTFLHHSQTCFTTTTVRSGLNTIRFYIILKLYTNMNASDIRLNTIRFYIILKRLCTGTRDKTGLNTIRFYIILKPQIQKWSASHAHTL